MIRQKLQEILPEANDEKILYLESKIRDDFEDKIIALSSGIDQSGRMFILVESKEASKRFDI